MDGWVKNFRKIEEWKYYKKPCHAHLFQHIVRRANFKDGYNSSAQLVRRGEMDYTLRQLASETGLSKKQVENILKDLKIGTEVGTVYLSKNRKEFSILSVTNYEKYQGESFDVIECVGTVEGTLGGRKGDARGTLGGHPKELKNENKAKKERSRKAKPAQTPKGFIFNFFQHTDQSFFINLFANVEQQKQTDLVEKHGTERIGQELEKIRTWALSNEKRWASKSDYPAFIANWFDKVSPQAVVKSRAFTVLDKNEQMKKEFEEEGKVITITLE